MKKCFKCQKVKPLSDYYKHPKMEDGHLNKCKECTKKDSRERESILKTDPVWVAKEKERSRLKFHRLGYGDKYKATPERKKATIERYKNKFPEKMTAHQKSQHIFKTNDLNEHHHWSYNDEHHKDVIELDPKDHAKIHRFLIYDQERMMYRRTTDHVLLDTKEEHQIWITHILNNL